MDIKPINENIKFPKVLVIDNNGKNLGPTKTSDAIKIAKEAKLDLILINTPKNEDQLPITKIGDYGKYLYEQKAKIKNSKQKVLKNKEITVRPQVGTHDLTWKAKDAIRWIADGNTVKFRIKAAGKVGFRPELVEETFNKFLSLLGDGAKVISPLKKITPIIYTSTIAKK